MSQPTLEERVASLEQKVARLKQLVPPKKDWRRTIGMFVNDPIMKEIDEETRKIRETDRRRSRKS